jgi:predicted NBD/HSP70 family sugar kinase
MRLSDQQYNRLSVLKMLREAQPISRTELAKISDLTGGTITAIVADLVGRGLIIEEKMKTRSRGRPRVLMSIKPSGAFVVGATLRFDLEGTLVIEISDLAGNSIYSQTASLSGTSQWDNLAHQYAEAVKKCIAASGVDPASIALVGIGLAAIVDNRSGVAIKMETFEPGPFPFADAVAKHLGLPVRLDNIMNLLARAEHWFGAAIGIDDFTMIYIDLGLGAGCYRSGQLVIGSHGIGSEFGHTKIVTDNGRPCHCGANGCLQAYCSVSGIVGQYRDVQELPDLPYFQLNSILTDMVRKAQSGDTVALDILRSAGRYLGIAVANHINMQDPKRIVILCRDSALVELIADSFFDTLKQNTLPALFDLTTVTFDDLTPQHFTKGAVAMVLEQMYQAS